MDLATANGETEPRHLELIVCDYPASPYRDVRTPFAVVQHTDAHGLTWFYPTNRHGRVSTAGHRDAESAAHAVDLMIRMTAKLGH